MGSKLIFSTFEVTRQAFYRTQLTYAIVNLKPIVPGHVLVIPNRVVPRLQDLNPPELSDLMCSIQHVGKVIERVYGADALTIACQDGKAAGQSVPHVHFHLLPRKLQGDKFAGRNDDIYPELERRGGELTQDFTNAPPRAEEGLTHDGQTIKMDAEEERKPRTLEEMEQEADWLRSFFEGVARREKQQLQQDGK